DLATVAIPWLLHSNVAPTYLPSFPTRRSSDLTLSDGQEYSAERLRGDWTPLIISLAVMARAHDESRIKSERVGQAWRRKKEAARSEKKPLTRRCPEWLQLVRSEERRVGRNGRV